ncbi:hypothetical protein BDR05DRAFT_996779 [Suillus weaverae]|nr:hypothetical protein BDR05DRAFT_996779 [Suillus weaverae]
MSQFELHAQLFAEKLKDPDNTPRYISVFRNARCRFVEMAVVVTEDEMVFLLLHGLVHTPDWLIFKHMTMSLYSTPPPASTSTTTTAVSTKMTFTAILSSLSKEVNHLQGEQRLNGPGLEYVNATSFRPPEGKMNLKTGVRIHKHNPKGVGCDNPLCSGQPWSLTHDHEHCFQPSGGMEGQSSNLSRNHERRLKKPDDVAAAANANDSSPSTSTPSTTVPPASTSAAAVDEYKNLACALIEDHLPLDPELYPSFDDIVCIAHTVYHLRFGNHF